jgi:hypothetical protein
MVIGLEGKAGCAWTSEVPNTAALQTTDANAAEATLREIGGDIFFMMLSPLGLMKCI